MILKKSFSTFRVTKFVHLCSFAHTRACLSFKRNNQSVWKSRMWVVSCAGKCLYHKNDTIFISYQEKEREREVAVCNM